MNIKKILIPVIVVLVAGNALLVLNIIPVSPDRQSNDQTASVYYTCPMHPSVVSDRPGDCPICGMSLVPRVSEPAVSEEEVSGMLTEVSISPRQRVLANVATSQAEVRSLEKKIVTVGRFDVDEQRMAHVAAWIGGRVERLYVDFTGTVVREGQPLLDIYSPALLQTQEEYLTTLPPVEGSESEVLRKARERLREATRRRLLLWGITEPQIEELERSRKAGTTTTIYAPASGTVLRKMVHEGMYVKEGQTLFDLADLSSIWMFADLYEQDIPFIELGQAVVVHSDAHPGRTFRGTIAFIDPVVNPRTRTVSIRANFRNRDGSLKPSMFSRAEIVVPLPSTLVVPASAVVNTGERQVVWEETAPNRFTPRHVVLGSRVGDWYQIVEGLGPGAAVASSGGFLLDSESQLKAIAGGAGLHAAMGHETSDPEHVHEEVPPGR